MKLDLNKNEVNQLKQFIESAYDLFKSDDLGKEMDSIYLKLNRKEVKGKWITHKN